MTSPERARDGAADEDDEARAAIRTRLDETLFVEAGAGTGKTTSLVARILELVGTGRTRMSQIAAITFTEAAAAELRDRVTEELERQAAGEEDPARAARFAEAVGEVDAAAIGTLHGFARRLLAEHPFEAGLPPTFEVLDEVRSSVAFEERWGAFLDDLLGSAAHGTAVSRALVLGMTLDALRKLAKRANDNWDLVDPAPRAPGPPLPVDAGAILGPLRGAAALAHSCADPADKLLVHLGEVVAWADRLAAASDELGMVRTLVRRRSLTKGNVGRAGAWGGRKDQVVALLAEAENARTTLLTALFHDAAVHLFDAVQALTVRAAGERRREGRLEFHDLLVLARDLLATSPAVARAVADRYRCLLIDEFQDTDPIQAELAVRIAGSARPHEDWRQMVIEPGRLFFVGDPKQSIYRFRRADIALFLEVRDRLAADVLQLTKNFRSVPGVVEWVNAVFGALVSGGDGHRQPSYEPLQADRTAHERAGSDPAVVLLGGEGTDDARADDVRRHAAAEVAACIEQVVAEGWPVGHEGERARRADIAILVPTRTPVPALQRALETAGIPYRLEAMSLVYCSSEVRELLSVLRAVDDPADDVAVVAALRTPALACGDDDLLGFKLAGGSWDYRTGAPEALARTHPVVVAMARLRALHDGRWWSDVSQLMEHTVRELRLFELALVDANGRECWRRLRFVLSEARLFADAFGGDLRTYLHWADLQCDEQARVTEAVLPESDDDAVRVLTMHASKGLEFPVVILTGLGTRPRAVDTTGVLWGPDGPEVSIRKDLRTAGYDALEAEEALMDEAERIRQLYVAATRARDHLIVALHRKAGEDSAAAILAEASAARTDLWRVLAPGGTGSAPGGSLPEEPVDATLEPEPEPERAEWVRARAELLGRARFPRSIAATAVAKEAAGRRASAAVVPEPVDDQVPALEEEMAPTDEVDEAPVAWRRGRGGTSIGRAVHAALQVVELPAGPDAPEVGPIARAQAVAHGVADRTAEVERLVRVALGSGPVRRAVASGRYWREIYVGVPVGDRVLEGIVDLLVEGPDGLEVVDYKTDQVADDAAIDRILERYRDQGAAYALALGRALGRPVVRCTFLFLRAGVAVEREVVDLAAAVAEVEGVLATL